MSTLKVTNIESPSGGGVNAKITDINGGQLSNRNLIYNGAMTVAQRGTSGTVATAGNYPSLDRWSCNDGGIGGFTVSQSTDAPAGFANSAKWACTSTGSATNDAFHEQKLEGQDVQQLAHGTSSAKSLTISFWVKSNKTGEYSLWIENNDANRYFTTPGYTINAANTWERKTITVPGDTAGSGFNNDNGVSLKLRWHLVLRTSFQGTPSGAWSTSASIRGQTGHVNFADNTSNEWYITGVQVEVGDVATAFEHRSHGDELARCQRYFQDFTSANSKIRGSRYNSSSGVDQTAYLPVRMRAQPNVTIVSSSDGGASSSLQVDTRAEEKIVFEANPTGSNTGVFMEFKFTCEAEL